jgi:DNA-binding MarR family transcriptional regulator
VVAQLYENGSLPPSALAERMHRDRARTSRTLTALVAKRLVLRTIPAHDRRSALVSLTPAGRQIYEVLMPQIQAINSQILKALQPEEAAQFDEALERLQARAQTLLTELSPDLPKANRRQGQRSKEVS